MVIQRLKIQRSGSSDVFEYEFFPTLNLIKSRYPDEIAYAIQQVTNHRNSCLPVPRASRSTRIEAWVGLSQASYRLVATPDPQKSDLCLRAYDEDGNEKTREYQYLTAHCAEQDLCEVFDADPEKTFFKPIQYLDEDHYYASNELSSSTDRLSETKSFRSYLKDFIKAFRPELIRDGKRYELCLQKNGRYVVRYRDDHGAPVLLSESEQTLFRYLCFLRTAEFWRGFEDLRNLHGVKKPILVKGFLERLDESIDIQEILERTRRLNRQTIILTV